MYVCGVDRSLAANDVFKKQVDGTIVGTESGLCVSSIPVPVPPPAPSNGSCSTALDCLLNGECTAGTCVCYPPWTAALDCSALEFLPSPPQRGYPTPGHNETSEAPSVRALGSL